MGKLTLYAWTKIYYAFSQNNKNMSDERKVKKREAENERYGQVKQRKHHMEFISEANVYLAALGNPTHSEISDINLVYKLTQSVLLACFRQRANFRNTAIPVKLKIVFLGK